LAARSILIVARAGIFSYGNVQWPIDDKYLSKMAAAVNKVSILYAFFSWRWKSLEIPLALDLFY